MEITKSYNNNSVTGTTTAAYVVALTIPNCAGALIQIRNTGAVTDLKYKISGYISGHPSGLETATVAETTLGQATSSAMITAMNYPCSKIVVSVISAEAEATTYQIDYIAY